jgi:hypothetical protein
MIKRDLTRVFIYYIVKLSVSYPIDFHPDNRGSIPLGDVTNKKPPFRGLFVGSVL